MISDQLTPSDLRRWNQSVLSLQVKLTSYLKTMLLLIGSNHLSTRLTHSRNRDKLTKHLLIDLESRLYIVTLDSLMIQSCLQCDGSVRCHHLSSLKIPDG